MNARENGAGEQQGRAGGLGSYLSRPRSGGDAPTTPVVGGGCSDAGRGRFRAARGRGWRRHVGPGGQRLRALGRLGGGCWRLCWAGSGAGLARLAGLSEAGRRAGPRVNRAAGEGEKACGPKFKKGEGKMILSFSFSSIFQNPI